MKKFQFMCPFFIQKAFKMKFKYSYILHCSCMIYAGAWSLHRMWYILHRTWCLLSYWKQSIGIFMKSWCSDLCKSNLYLLNKADNVEYGETSYNSDMHVKLNIACVKKWKSWWQNIRSKNCQQICIKWKEKNDCDM